MNAKTNIRYVAGVTVLEVTGRITLGEGAVTLRDAIENALRYGTKKLVIDLGGVSYMDSAGVGELTSAYTTSKNRGCDLKLVRLTWKLEGIMQITKLATIFDIYSDEEEAIASFSKYERAVA